MRKLSLIIIAFTLVLFTQCKKEKITENTNPVGEDGGMVPITLELPVDNGAKTNFEDFLTNPLDPQGTIKWRTDGIAETVYLAVPNKIIYNDETGEVLVNQPYAQMIPLTGTLQDGGTSIIFTGNVDKRILTDGYSYTLYYFGNNGGKKDEVFSQYFNRNIITSVSMSLDGQNGSRDNLGDYHFATLDIHVHAEFEPVQLPNGQGQVAKSYAIHTNYPYFTTQVAIAYLNFTDLVQTLPTGEESSRGFYLYGNDSGVQMANSVKVEFNNGNNTYEIDYFTGAETQDELKLMYIKLSDNVKTKLDVNGEEDPKSFIVLAPGVTTIKADGEGTYTFAGSTGTQVNHVYFTKNVSTNEILPLKWTE